jgi:hypothetical protein
LWTPIVVERVVNLLNRGGSVWGPIIELGVLTVLPAASTPRWCRPRSLAVNGSG